MGELGNFMSSLNARNIHWIAPVVNPLGKPDIVPTQRGQTCVRIRRAAPMPQSFSQAITGTQIAKSVYSGFTATVGADNMPAATVVFVPCSIKINEPVNRLVV